MKRSAVIVLATLALLLAQSVPGHAHVHGGIWIGPVWGPGWWGPVYPYAYPYPYYAPPVVIQQQPQEYIQQQQPAAPEQQYWYFCPDPQGYYPYVAKCPKGWMKVLPSTSPEASPEAPPQ